MRNKSIIAIYVCVLAASLILGSTGVVSLANPEEGMEHAAAKEKDRLIGVFVTTEHLDLFDFEGYMNDNIDKIMKGGEITEEDSESYRGRLYALLSDVVLTDEETGEKSTHKEYVFKDTEGILYCEAKIDENGESYYVGSSDEGISDGHLGITVNDAGESIHMKGTIYMSATGELNCLYYNPVYQTEEGHVYTVTGNGYSYGGDTPEGMSGTVTFEETNSCTVNGETLEVGTVIEMTHSFIFPPVEIIITQMSKDNQVVDRQQYEPGEVPRELVPKADTEYIIVETVKVDGEGNRISDRAMYQRADDTLETFYCREDDICVKKSTALQWEKQ